MTSGSTPMSFRLDRVNCRQNNVKKPASKNGFKNFCKSDYIGRRSVSIDLVGFTLGIGITSTDFQNCGNVRCVINRLNMAQTGSASEEANS